MGKLLFIMKRPIKRPITLRKDFLYEMKDGRRGILVIEQPTIAIFRVPYRKCIWFIVNWKEEVVKRLRRKTDCE